MTNLKPIVNFMLRTVIKHNANYRIACLNSKPQTISDYINFGYVGFRYR